MHKLVAEIKQAKATKIRSCIYVNEGNWRRFHELCKKLGISTSSVVDRGISRFLRAYDQGELAEFMEKE